MTVSFSEVSQTGNTEFTNSSMHERLEKLESMLEFVTSEVSGLKEDVLSLERTNAELRQFISQNLSRPPFVASPKAPPNTPRRSVGAISTGDESNGSDIGCGRLVNHFEALPEQFHSILASMSPDCSREGARCPRLEDTYTH
jgi:hypothetical protein